MLGITVAVSNCTAIVAHVLHVWGQGASNHGLRRLLRFEVFLLRGQRNDAVSLASRLCLGLAAVAAHAFVACLRWGSSTIRSIATFVSVRASEMASLLSGVSSG